jgi:hypothetical protein
VAKRKLAAQPKPAAQQTVEANSSQHHLPTDFRGKLAKFAEMKGVIGDGEYYRILGTHGAEHANLLETVARFQAAYDAMVMFAKTGGEAAR